METWRQQGPLGKLHNIVVYIQRSTQRIQAFKELSGGRRLVRDNSTRWNSWFMMIRTAIEPRIQLAINLFCIKYQDTKNDILSDDDWGQLQKIYAFLQSFHEATLATEGRTASIEKVLPTMDFLLERFENAKIEYADDPFMGPCCNAGWAKLDKYYSLTERSPAYIASMVLVPWQKWSYFEDNWPVEWVSDARTTVQRLWEQDYKSTATLIPEPELQGPQTELQRWHASKRRQAPVIDEYSRYCSALRTPEVDSRSWWMEPAQRTTYPALSVMALDLLSIPAMSAEPERLFSSAKITITDRKNRLQFESIEAIECLKSWLDSRDTAWAEG